jgi:hypothetical protein
MSGNGHTDDEHLCLFVGVYDSDEEAIASFESGNACGNKAVWEVWFHDESCTMVCEKHLAEVLDFEQPQILQYIGDRHDV